MRTVVVVRTGEERPTAQGLQQFEGISAQSVGSRGLCAHLLRIPPGGRAKAHRHAGHETAISVLEGRAVVWFGERLELRLDVAAGEFMYIPPDVPHLPINGSATDWARAVVARTDPNEQESVELLPDLDDLPHLQASPPAAGTPPRSSKGLGHPPSRDGGSRRKTGCRGASASNASTGACAATSK